MRILITGVAGVLGSHMADRYILEGHNVVGVDNFSSGKQDNINHLMGNEKFHLLKQDIIQPIDLSLGKFDQIYNFACVASPPLYQLDPIHTMLTSVAGLNNILYYAYKTGGAIVFQASTSEVYGDPLEHPQKESYNGNINSVGPRSCYDLGKKAAETLCMDYHRKYGVSVRIARIFNTYSSRNNFNDGRVVPNFIKQALANQDITVYGNGSQTRSLCHWRDAIDGYYMLVNNTHCIEPINIGNTEEVTMLELAKMIIELTDSKSKIIFKELPTDDPARRNPDITMANKIMGWYPKISMYDGLNETINDYKLYLEHSK